MSELDLLQFPLHGRRLIEASAGTGKTYSITALHLRALLGHGVAAPVPIDRILVMTFTEAATDSLRERVRARIADARDALQQASDGAKGEPTNEPPGDAFIASLVPQVDDVEGGLRLLRAATTLVDTAAIHTLHGFCMRALREQAFASGAPFAQEFSVDDSAQVRIAATDAWRSLTRHDDALLAGLLLTRWPGPDELQRELASLLTRDDVELRGVPDADLDTALSRLHALLDGLAAFLRAHDMPGLIAGGRSGLGADKKLGDLASGPMTAALACWLAGDPPPWTSSGIGLRKLVNACAHPRMRAGKSNPLVDEMAEVALPALAAIDDLLRVAFVTALARTRERLRSDKLAQGWIAPDDLLRDMLAALQGPAGERFAAVLRARYPIAMVDEFQDTDSVQWQILNAIYPPSSAPDAPACILIGDPKQSIYGFRGADVYSYLQAAASIDADSRRELRRSFRASPELVRALNRLYRDRDGFVVPDIAYRDVESGLVDRPGRVVSFTERGQALAPLRFEFCADENGGKPLATGKLLARMARATAWRIRALLDGQVAVDGKALEADDIAVLVRNWNEGRRVRDALRAVGLDAGFQSQDSVFAGDTARDLRFALRAALAPEDETRLRAFALTALGGADARTLAAMPLESPAWQRIAERFRAPLDVLHEHGVLAWLRQWLRQDGAAVRLQALADGRRRLTDLRHVAELLELEWRRTRSVVQVADWLDARIDAAAQEKEETRLLRLDSDEGLIRIRTLHGAKGLEYGVVFLPFLWTGRSDDRAVLHEPVPAPGSGYRAYVDLSGDDLSGSDAQAMRHAVLAEDLRLLYVGLTRACRACYVGVARGSTSGTQVPLLQTALGHLLFGAGHADDLDSLRRSLEALAEDTPEIAVALLPPDAGDVPMAPTTAGARAGSRAVPAPRTQVVTAFERVIPDRWRISSYSSMVAGRHALDPTPGVADEPELARADPAAAAFGTGAPAAAAQSDLPAVGEARGPADSGRPALPFHLRFPRGPAAGSLLHDVLERWDHDGDRRQRADALVRAHGFARAGEDERIDLDALLAWLTRVRETPLAPLVPAGIDVEPPTLASLVLHAEVEFAMPLRGGDSTALDAVLRRHGYLGEPLGAQRWQGLLKGFMDVVFAWRGRYVVLDYKSNHLGDDASCYAGESLHAAMRAHRYELQLLIYAVALRRWLRRRGVADARPVGLYWFLRGIDAPGAGLWHHEPSAAVLDELDAVFDGEAGT